MKFKNSFSSDLPNQHGIPQRTILGPILFDLYINDIVCSNKYCKIAMFADDTMLYITGNDLEEMSNKINYDLSFETFEKCSGKKRNYI